MPQFYDLLMNEKRIHKMDIGKNPSVDSDMNSIDGLALKSLDEIKNFELFFHEPASELELASEY